MVGKRWHPTSVGGRSSRLNVSVPVARRDRRIHWPFASILRRRRADARDKASIGRQDEGEGAGILECNTARRLQRPLMQLRCGDLAARNLEANIKVLVRVMARREARIDSTMLQWSRGVVVERETSL